MGTPVVARVVVRNLDTIAVRLYAKEWVCGDFDTQRRSRVGQTLPSGHRWFSGRKPTPTIWDCLIKFDMPLVTDHSLLEFGSHE